jgi:hypothetical protein
MAISTPTWCMNGCLPRVARCPRVVDGLAASRLEEWSKLYRFGHKSQAFSVRAIRSDWIWTGQSFRTSPKTTTAQRHTKFFLLGVLVISKACEFSLAVRPVTSSRKEKPPISWSDLKSWGQLKTGCRSFAQLRWLREMNQLLWDQH